MPKAIGSHKVGKVIASIRTRLAEFTDEKYPKKEILTTINDCTDEFHELSGTKNEPEYRDSMVIPVSRAVSSIGGTGASYDASDKKIVIPLTGTGIEWINDESGFDDSWIGAFVVITIGNAVGGIENPNIEAPGGGQRYTSIVESVPNTTSVILESTGYTLPSADLSGATLNISIQLLNNEVDTIDLSQLSNFKRIDKITTIESDLHEVVEMQEKDFNAVSRYDPAESPYGDTIIWKRHGDILHFNKGSLTGYGTRTMNFTRLPILCVTYNDFIDIKDTGINLLKDMVALKIIATLEARGLLKPNTESRIGEMRKAVNDEKAKLGTKN